MSGEFPISEMIECAIMDSRRYHKADGDMWPITWAADGHCYGAAGDNLGSPMNVWRIEGHPGEPFWGPYPHLFLIDNLPIDPKEYCQRPHVHPHWGVKPASLLSLNGVLYFAVQLMNFGDNPSFNRQHNISSWIITSDDNGNTWNREATRQDFFDGRLASPHFIQFGQDYEGARDEFVYAYFPAATDGNSYWCNGDYLLLGKVRRDRILERDAWTFYSGDEHGQPVWHSDADRAAPVFEYPLMTGENHVSFNKGLNRYIMGNFSFTDKQGNPRPYHQQPGDPIDDSRFPSQLTLFEAPNPWGPWSLFHQDNNWGSSGDYQPIFPTKWISEDGKEMWMVSSGSEEDYNFTFQKVRLKLR